MRRRWWSVALAALVAVSCSGGDATPKPPTASVTATTLSAVEREVEAAYLKSWDIYADAALHLTTARLEESYAGEQLLRTRHDIEDRIATRRTARFRVEHHYTVQLLPGTRAEVRDRYVNHSVLVDPATQEPMEADPNEIVEDIFTLQVIGGTWRVVRVRSA